MLSVNPTRAHIKTNLYHYYYYYYYSIWKANKHKTIMLVRLLQLLAILVLFSAGLIFADPEEEEVTTQAHHHRAPAANFSSIPAAQSLFKSNCTYRKVSEVSDEQECNKVQLSKEYNIEILLPVTLEDVSQSIFVPFIIDPSVNEITLSLEAQQKLGIDRDMQNVTILHSVIPARKAEESVIGLNFLEESLVAIDFYAKQVGIEIGSQDGNKYQFNWPLDTFRDIHSEKVANRVAANFQRLKKKFERQQAAYKEEIKSLSKELKKKDKFVHKLIEKKNILKDAYRRRTQRKRKVKMDL